MLTYYYSKIIKKLRGAAIKNSRVHPTSAIEPGSLVVSSTLEKHSFCGYDCEILNCHIGSFCSIGSNVTIGGVAHPIEFVSTSPVFLSHKDSVKEKFAQHDYLPQIVTTIGNDVWIGKGAYLKAGITVGHGAVIGMGAVVTKSIPPYSVVAGNPAKLIKMRFDDNIIHALLALNWWDWPESELQKYGQYFNDPLRLLQEKGGI
ncbi:CatB-related O-acetyltransferase [Alcaligenes faecalis]|nr:CatB-related O-acetyltransferase [Alcaligenes faecalis]